MQTSPKNDRWQLTEETLACLLTALHRDEAQAIARYERLHKRLVFFFMGSRCICPEDLADEVVNRLARKITEGEAIANFEAYALGIGRMIAREEQARVLREQRLSAEFGSNTLHRQLTSNNETAMLDAMEEQFTLLPSHAKNMLVRYHSNRGLRRIQERRKLAEEMGISIGTLRKRIFDMQALIRMRLKGRPGGTTEPQSKEQDYL